MHPPDNMINSLISFVNSLVYTRLLSEIYHTQLNPTISYLHEPGVRRYSLCLDISEVFKPLIGDRLIFSLLNRRQITEDSFTKELNYLHLKKEASKLIVSEFENRMKKTIMHKELGRQVSYQYLMRLEAYKLIKHLIGEKEYEGFIKPYILINNHIPRCIISLSYISFNSHQFFYCPCFTKSSTK